LTTSGQHKVPFTNEHLEVRDVYQYVLPRRKIISCTATGWMSRWVQAAGNCSDEETVETTAASDQLVVIATKGQGEIESFSDGFWRGETYQPHSVGLTPSGWTKRLRFRPNGRETLEVLQVYIPARFFDGAKDEYRRRAAPFRGQPLSALSFHDPVIAQVALSLREAIETGVPDLYAQSAVQFLATHLLSTHGRWSDAAEDNRCPGTLGGRRLARVLEYMKVHYKESLSLNQLAEEAGISCFHFMHLFKKSVGTTPHHYLIRIRMDAAALLLRNTDLSVMEIALACGYQSAAHFSAAFQKQFSRSPSQSR